MILASVGVNYEILEANPADPAGPVDPAGPYFQGTGRTYTYHFSNEPNDYYDVGAMRLPHIPFMDLVFNLLGSPAIAPNVPLIPYILSTENNLNFFNGIVHTNEGVQVLNAAGNFDPFATGIAGLDDTVDNMIGAALNPFEGALVADFVEGWAVLMEADGYSTRSYMALAPDLEYSHDVIDYLETFGTASNLYDCALSESVMDSLDFDFPADAPVEWFCVQGGMGRITNAMAGTLDPERILRGRRVTAIAPVIPDGEGFATSVNLTVAADGPPLIMNYSHVISSIPLSSLRMVDTKACGLSWKMKTALRALHYDSSVKVAIRFQYRWWEHDVIPLDAPAHPIIPQLGGVSSTDRPTRTVVYPSYGMGGPDATMIVSYTWAQDALRFGAFVENDNPGAPEEAILIDTILKDLADMHGIPDYAILPGLMVDHHAHNWYGNEHTGGWFNILPFPSFPAGAFALYGPGQFANLYPEVTTPPAGLVHFAGEATSAHHAWIVGALNSAFRTVHEIVSRSCVGRP
ncbi:hypothetical protein BOTBODRAFT_105219 [Botryobasidium botryosum FD-172 SS1]|uniref:Amine oxidase domain-containing protein n=1 Tax=Botryobasidium botryosum (strain FD-172 SS1) TaxID=930990 RepID=A0A067N0W4_BOTB1|nr:hypothetical protein BOTBODRAFT_105219 [Botryobasidium botryosum FD-172 SS1]